MGDIRSNHAKDILRLDISVSHTLAVDVGNSAQHLVNDPSNFQLGEHVVLCEEGKEVASCSELGEYVSVAVSM